MINFSLCESPCYVLDEQKFVDNLKIIDHVRRQARVQIILALKGFAMWGAFPILREAGFNAATASSLAEARLALEEMGSPAYTYAPVYTDTDIDDIAACSSHLTFNSITQYHRFAQRARTINANISLGLRVNPRFSTVSTDLYNPCAPGSRLGIDAQQLDPWPKDLQGLHVHALCESSAADTEGLILALEQRFGEMFDRIQWLNLGGGHLMTRKDYDTNRLIAALKGLHDRHPHLHIILEPGAAFAWESGYLVSTVEDIVANEGIQTAMLNVSFTAHMPDCLEMPYQPKVLSALENTNPQKPSYRLGGNSCLSGDYMGNWSFENPLQVGDQIVFNDMIHYTMVKTNCFNGIQHPAIAIWTRNDEFQVVKRFTYEDYKNRLS